MRHAYIFTGSSTEGLPVGKWRAWLECPGGELPFFLDIQGDRRVYVINGSERIEVPAASFKAGSLRLAFLQYDSEILAYLKGGSKLEGTWRKRRGQNSWVEMPWHAVKADGPRFSSSSGPLSPQAMDRLTGIWAVQFEKDVHPAVGHFEVKADSTATGTFLTTLGDYRYLAGNYVDGQLSLSCFDGAHAFLFKAKLLSPKEGSLAGDFWSSDTWHETWTARKDPEAKLPDAYSLTKWTGQGPSALGGLAFPDLEGKLRPLDDPAFSGKARILVLFGTWCPNCNDSTRYMVELDRRYRDKGLSILGLAFEHTGDPIRDSGQVRIYRQHHGARYPMLVAGLSNKEEASQAFPLLDQVRSYPTTIFLHGDGRVHSVHQGFSGPATGVAYEELRERFEGIIQELLR